MNTPNQQSGRIMSASELAGHLGAGSGTVCFADTAGAGRWGGEWVAARPDKVVRGRLPGEAPPVPRDGEFWAGTIDYDGVWCFSRYPGWWWRPAPGTPWLSRGDAGDVIQEPPPPPATLGNLPEPARLHRGMKRADFTRMVRRAKEYIAAGDIYQVNLSHRFEACWDSPPDPRALWDRMSAVSPSPHAAWLEQEDRVVLSASPETFLQRDGRRLLTRPIKGTRPRGGSPEQDATLRAELQSSEKERAELIMITDLERNDLGRIAVTGGVRVDELCVLESFAQVHHLVSTVSADLREDAGWPEIWRAVFPGGSITGAPKKRAMEIIRELEPEPRGLYTGAIGWMAGPDHGCFSIAIRTAVQRGNRLVFHAGSGIVEGSDPDAEFEETHHKAAGWLKAVGLP